MANPYTTRPPPEIVELEDDATRHDVADQQQQLEDGVDIVEEYDDDDNDDDDNDDGEDDDGEYDDEGSDVFDPAEQLCQLMVSEDGTPIADILLGIRDALERHNKILYKAVTVLESRK